MAHGHARADRRNLHLHRVAFEKLRHAPALRGKCLALVDEWLAQREHDPCRPSLLLWRTMLAEWPIERIAETVLDADAGQTLRQNSPLAPALTPRERWAALDEVNAEMDLERSAPTG